VDKRTGLNLLEAVEALRDLRRVRMTGKRPFTPECPELKWDGKLCRAGNSTEHSGHWKVLGISRKWIEATYEIIEEES